MTSLTPFTATDLLYLNPTNLDVLTENYHIRYYLMYMHEWPSLNFKLETQEHPVGYMIGKSEGKGTEWHSHITALTVAPAYRRLGVGRFLIHQLKESSEAPDQNCYFMDLFVRSSNKIAVDMYKKFQFHVFRRVLQYYGTGKHEDAFDMRMKLARDTGSFLKKTKWTEESHHYEYRYDAAALE